jgi:hypothetical protein
MAFFFLTISNGENANSGLDGTVTLLMVIEKQFTVPHGTNNEHKFVFMPAVTYIQKEKFLFHHF